MSEELNEELDSENQPTEEVVNTEEVEEVDVANDNETEDDSEALEEKNRKLFERAKKAEAEARRLKTLLKSNEPKAEVKQPSQKQDGLTTMDTIALINAKVTEKEDIDEVLDYAKLKGISVSEALKSTVVKTILSERVEQRRTAEATNTGTARRGSAQLSSEQILANASKGRLPDDPVALAEAHMAAKIKK